MKLTKEQAKLVKNKLGKNGLKRMKQAEVMYDSFISCLRFLENMNFPTTPSIFWPDDYFEIVYEDEQGHRIEILFMGGA